MMTFHGDKPDMAIVSDASLKPDPHTNRSTPTPHHAKLQFILLGWEQLLAHGSIQEPIRENNSGHFSTLLRHFLEPRPHSLVVLPIIAQQIDDVVCIGTGMEFAVASA